MEFNERRRLDQGRCKNCLPGLPGLRSARRDFKIRRRHRHHILILRRLSKILPSRFLIKVFFAEIKYGVHRSNGNICV